MLFAVVTVASAAWALFAREPEPPQPAAPPGSEVWVQLRVRVEADRTRQGGAWDWDSSPPEMRVTLHPRDETVVVGPCESSRECEGVVHAVRLSPGVPFRVVVDEMDYVYPEREGAAWLWWRGGRDESVRARIGATDVTVTVHRIAMQPTTSATPAVQTPPDAGATSRSTIRSTARSDAGAPRRNAPTRSRSRTRATPISPTQPVDPRGDDPETPPPPLVPIGAF